MTFWIKTEYGQEDWVKIVTASEILTMANSYCLIVLYQKEAFKNILVFHFFIYSFRESVHEQGGERKGHRKENLQADSPRLPLSAEPNLGLNSTILRSQPKRKPIVVN